MTHGKRAQIGELLDRASARYRGSDLCHTPHHAVFTEFFVQRLNMAQTVQKGQENAFCTGAFKRSECILKIEALGANTIRS